MWFANLWSFRDLFWSLWPWGSNQSFANPFPEFLTPIDQSQAKTLYIFFSIQDHNKAMEAAQQQKAAAAANGGRAASGQPQMRDSPNDNRGGNFFNMSMESDKNISTWSPDCVDHKNSTHYYMKLVQKIAVKNCQNLIFKSQKPS